MNNYLIVFNNLDINLSREKLIKLLDTYFKDRISNIEIINLVLLMIHTRDHINGLGLKDVSRWIMLYLYKLIPNTITELLGFYITNGYFRDLSLIIENMYNDGYTDEDSLIKKCYDMYAWQLMSDYNNYCSNNINDISLCVKYIPKQNSCFQRKYKMTTKLVNRIFTSDYYGELPNTTFSYKMKTYRSIYVPINKLINTTEVLMSQNRWDEIDFTQVPIKCLKYNNYAFTNSNTCDISKLTDEKRNTCRENYINYQMDSITIKKAFGYNDQPYKSIKYEPSEYTDNVDRLRIIYEDIYNYIESSDLISSELYIVVMNYDDIVLSKFNWEEQHHMNPVYTNINNTDYKNSVRFNIPTLSPLTPNSTPRTYLSPPPAPRGDRFKLNELTIDSDEELSKESSKELLDEELTKESSKELLDEEESSEYDYEIIDDLNEIETI